MKLVGYSRFRYDYLNALLLGKPTDLLVLWGWNPIREAGQA